MDLIDRYVYAVVRRLPHSQREEVAAELKSLITDMLDERTNGNPADRKDVKIVLLELGHPREMADKYSESRKYLIGPELYDSFKTVLKIVLLSIAFAVAVIFAIQSILEPHHLLDHFIDFILSLVQIPIAALGWVTLIFAGIQYFGIKSVKNLDDLESWDPEELPEVPDEKSVIKRSETIINIIFTIFFGFLIGASYFAIPAIKSGDSFVSVPFLNKESFSVYFPLILLLVGFGILKEILKLVSGKWTKKLAIQISLVSLLSLATVLIMIALEAPFWNPDFMSELAGTGIIQPGTELYQTIERIWSNGTIIIVILTLFGFVLDSVLAFFKSVKNV